MALSIFAKKCCNRCKYKNITWKLLKGNGPWFFEKKQQKKDHEERQVDTPQPSTPFPPPPKRHRHCYLALMGGREPTATNLSVPKVTQSVP